MNKLPNAKRVYSIALALCAPLFLLWAAWWAATAEAKVSALIVVTSNDDNVLGSNGLCTLREAINNANDNMDTTNGDCTAGSGDDQITFATAGIITLTSGELTLQNNGALTINGGGVIMVSANNASRHFTIEPGGSGQCRPDDRHCHWRRHRYPGQH